MQATDCVGPLNRMIQIFARFFFVTDPDGYKIEVLERVVRFADQ